MDRRIGQPVVNIQALAPGAYHPGLAQRLQMTRGVGHRKAGEARQNLDTMLALRQILQKLQAMPVPRRAADARQLGIKLLLEVVA